MRIDFEDVTKTYTGRTGSVLALDRISFSIREGEFICLVGPSGCGKSTLCNMLAGFEFPSSGRVSLNGESVKGPSIERAMMFQEPALFPWLDVQSNIEFGLRNLKVPARERRARAQHFLEMVHLSQFASAQPHELSGGMRQRVALARALAVDPKVLLMDEPFGALDAQTRDHLHLELQNIWAKTQKTVVFVTHSVREAVTLASRIIVFRARPGRIKREFDLEDLKYPRRATETLVSETIAHVQHALHDDTLKSSYQQFHQNGGAPTSSAGVLAQ